mmetsp:Transcript_25763/g.47373  ORF Transcript_25763/g.47373 Transcript_25763/m.47373 type:complete len:269 (+) Transcript_25763:137-943(+)
MLLERNAPCSSEDDIPAQDRVKSNQATQVVDAVHDKANPPIDMIVLSTCPDDPCRTEVKRSDMHICGGESSDADTAECSISSGDSFVPHEMSSRDDGSVRTNCSQRSILRAESRISEPQEKPSHQRKRRIRFGTVLFRDYDIILGDHPCCSYGPPLTIDWDYHQCEPIDVDAYEFENALSRRTRREMRFNYYQRKRLLSDAGFTEVDFELTKKELNRAKLNRSITRQVVSHSPLLKVETAVESVCRKFKRLIKEDHWKEQKSLYPVSA